MAAKTKPKKKKAALPKSAEALRQKILSDPNTAQIAKNLGVPLDEYVRQVMHFVNNPEAEPTLYLVEDEDLRKMGYPPPDEEAMGKYLIEAAEVSEAAGGTGFSKAKKPLVETPELANVDQEYSNPHLKKELEKQLKGKRRG